MSKNYEPLSMPPSAKQIGGAELLRVGIVGDRVGVSLRRGFDDPRVWGDLLAGVARDVARMYAADLKIDADAALKQILDTFATSLQTPQQDNSAITPIAKGGAA